MKRKAQQKTYKINPLLILVLILVSTTVQSQKAVNGLDTLISKTRIRMSTKQITNYVILTNSNYSNITTYYESLEEKKETFLTNLFQAYIFWQENAKCFVQLIDKDFTYEPLPIDNCGFLKLDSKTIDQISKEEVLPIVVLSNKEKVYIEVSNHYKTKFYFSRKNSKEFPNFYLSEPEKRNINNFKNSKLQITKLYRACEKIIIDNFPTINSSKRQKHS
ncbi:hypothetical protein [Flavobacterium poyangense]|uniref:hypothetical protein n=1 Tax=Flavobacterium poyangense TaxID=2204302 RepID=UPI0014200872|nr:hypothetical protein [Flavobacterium sp. JXAS1]